MSRIKKVISDLEEVKEHCGCESSDGTAALSYIGVEHYNSDNNWTGFHSGRKNRNEVIAWMPLPEPYKEGGK